jgi:hypothetical protein
MEYCSSPPPPGGQACAARMHTSRFPEAGENGGLRKKQSTPGPFRRWLAAMSRLHVFRFSSARMALLVSPGVANFTPPQYGDRRLLFPLSLASIGLLYSCTWHSIKKSTREKESKSPTWLLVQPTIAMPHGHQYASKGGFRAPVPLPPQQCLWAA